MRHWRSKALFALAMTALVGGCGETNFEIAPGVPWDLAEHRVQTISEIQYRLQFDIPDSMDEPINGRVVVSFTLSDISKPVVLDFTGPDASVLAVNVDGESAPYEVAHEHIVVPTEVFQVGPNVIEIEFAAGNGSLNRREEFLYTLFVPDRARFAFPLFDQPNLKARYSLELTVPNEWRALANGEQVSHAIEGDRATFVFDETRPISSYLFSFAAGKFQVEEAERDGRVMRMFHRETDPRKVARNATVIFDLHAEALEWLEAYTDIPYPFDKFDFVLIPAFQYGGMEHPGAIVYRQASLMLDESVTQNQLLGRASVIAHETAHQWFGDLVTMNWFDDVWTKEVFANFMAAKIVNPSFPEVDHDLRFFLAHYPSAYGVDRTSGTHAVRQQLDNLNAAGTLYGSIIYQKAPIVMKHLEILMGESQFRDGLRTYLDRFRYGNATWPDLVAILDQNSPENVTEWSDVWVQGPGRPTVSYEKESVDGVVTRFTVLQQDEQYGNRVWSQNINVVFGYEDGGDSVIPARLDGRYVNLPQAVGLNDPSYILLNGDGIAYGRFVLDDRDRQFLLENVSQLTNPMTRAVSWVNLWEEMLEGNIGPGVLLRSASAALTTEDDELVQQRLLGYVNEIFWKFLSESTRRGVAESIEESLWTQLTEANSPTIRTAYFSAYRNIALSDVAVGRLYRIWNEEEQVPGVTLSESDMVGLAKELAIRLPDRADAILGAQLENIRNADRKARFEFVMPALSPDQASRDLFFERLKDAANRDREPWVLDGVNALHHPLRAEESERYVPESLQLLEEIQRTGDIFFPQRWLAATLDGHSSQRVARMVREYLEDNEGLDSKLRAKLLQTADPLFRAASILDAETEN